MDGPDLPESGAGLCGCLALGVFAPCPCLAEGLLAVSALFPAQTGEIVALKKVALRRLEDGIPNQALREIKALQEIEDSQYVSGAGLRRAGWAQADKAAASRPFRSFPFLHAHLAGGDEATHLVCICVLRYCEVCGIFQHWL